MERKVRLIIVGFFVLVRICPAQNIAQDSISVFNLQVFKNMRLTGYTQVRYQNPEQEGKLDYFDIRRARLDLKGVISDQFDYRLQTDFGGGSVKLLDAIITYKPLEEIAVQVGQFKIPLSAENNTPSNKMDFINRSQAVEALVARGTDVIGSNNGRDIGVQLSGNLFKYDGRNFLDWYAGIFNGQGINVADVNRSKDVVGRLLIHPVKGFTVGGSVYSGYDQPLNSIFNQKRNRFAGEVNYVYRIISLQGEFISGEDGSIRKQGYYGYIACYVLPKTLQLVARYDYYDKNKSLKEDASTYITGGANYLFNNNAKLQVNYEVHKEEGPEIKNNIFLVMFQLSF